VTIDIFIDFSVCYAIKKDYLKQEEQIQLGLRALVRLIEFSGISAMGGQVRQNGRTTIPHCILSHYR